VVSFSNSHGINWVSQCIYNQSLDLKGIHFFPCACDGKKTALHDVNFMAIVKDVKFHVS
jgi:hypothetical protein